MLLWFFNYRDMHLRGSLASNANYGTKHERGCCQDTYNSDSSQHVQLFQRAIHSNLKMIE